MGRPVSRHGWLGWLRARYEITPDRVTVTRSWLPAVLIPLLALGTWLLVKGLAHSTPDPEVTPPMIAGFIAAVTLCHVLGIFGVVFTPWFGPRRIEATPDGITVGRQRIAAADVASIEIEVRTQRGRGGPTYTVFIAVQSQYVIESFRMAILWSNQQRPAQVVEVIEAMRRVAASALPPRVDDGGGQLPR